MISKASLGLNTPGPGYTGCVGVNVAQIPRWFKEMDGFWPYAPPFPLGGQNV